MIRAFALAALAVFVLSDAAAAPQLVSHRAVYAISLEHTSGGGVVAARGRLAIQFRDTCDGWSTTQRLIADMADSEGALSRTDFSVSAWESKDGRTMRFDIVERHRGHPDEHQRGSASLGPDGAGQVDLAVGHPAKFSLPRGTEFPTGQMLGILQTAQAGGASFKHLVFQGGDATDLNFATAVIGRAVDGASLASDRKADNAGLIRRVSAWRVLISFFPLSTRAETPDYEVASHLFANGINGSMSLIYPNYRLRATLTRLEPLPRSC